MKALEFSKFHGLGNDFIIIENFEEQFDLTPAEISTICDRNFGVGADGLILVEKSDVSDFNMAIYNSDGSRAEMCGNGIRCFAKYVYDRGYISKENIKIETLAGIMDVRLHFHGSEVNEARVNMGKPSFKPQDIPMLVKDVQEVVGYSLDIGEKFINVTCLSMGNPHCIVYVEKVETAPIRTLGSLIERHHLFPNRTNVEFVEVEDKESLRVKVWERGAGETLACGTGACASLAASFKNGHTSRRATVKLPGGELLVEWNRDGSIFLTGPAEEVFTGFLGKNVLDSLKEKYRKEG